MRDIDIRNALHRELETAHGGELDTLVVDELGLCQGTARIDVAVINGFLNGYEIKSERDTLERLPAQEEVYSRIFDRVTIVASEQHVTTIHCMVPEWWGITAAISASSGISLDVIRSTEANPCIDAYAVAQLLWRDEVFTALKEYGLDKGMLSKPRRILWQQLADNLPPTELCAIVRNRIKTRQNWRSAGSQKSGDELSLSCAK